MTNDIANRDFKIPIGKVGSKLVGHCYKKQQTNAREAAFPLSYIPYFSPYKTHFPTP